MIDLNFTLLIQLVNFLVTLVVLNALLIRPIRGIIKLRADKMSGLMDEAETFLAEADQKLQNYETALANARSEAAGIRDAKKAEGLVEEQSLITTASGNAHTILQTSRKQIATEMDQAMVTLKSQVDTLAEKAAGKVLG